jgi:hypothetical protein
MFDPLAGLRRTLRRGDTVLFVGAGLSTWSGLPTWWHLITLLGERLQVLGKSPELVLRERDRGNLLQAASYGVMSLTGPQFGQFIRDAVQWGTARPSEAHRLVASLGPTCFIATNYDQLLEDALREVHEGRPFRVITNNHVTEIADIVQARAERFVFKPHGDVNDVDSIVLAREQYRSLHGERKRALDALSVLLVSRPVVFLGFGLQDPDFLYVKDLLSLTYRGGTVEHYAIVADVVAEEKRWWQEQYGIELIGYETKTGAPGVQAHSAFLTLLRELTVQSVVGSTSEATVRPAQTDEQPRRAPSELLTLARYAARVQQETVLASKRELPLRVSARNTGPTRSVKQYHVYDGMSIERFLQRSYGSAILIGPPGAGKTYAMRRYAGVAAAELHAACLHEQALAGELPPVVIAVDMKLYRGDLRTMVEDALPAGIELDHLLVRERVRLLLDSYNEVPREYQESDRLATDLRTFLQHAGSAVVTIGSRTADGLSWLDWPTVTLDQLDTQFIEHFLSELKLSRPLPSAVMWVLAKPFFFRLAESWDRKRLEEATPRRIYESYFDRIESALRERASCEAEVSILLSGAAFDALDGGRETMGVVELEAHLSRALRSGGHTISARALISFLIGEGLLVALPGSRVAFFHQSITEHLAATELARLYAASPSALERCLRSRRWDQALFLTLGHLPQSLSESFIRRVVEVDLELAVRAAGFLEHGQSEVVAQLLQTVAETDLDTFEELLRVASALESLPVGPEHEARLWSLVRLGNALGGAAAACLVNALGDRVKAPLLDALFAQAEDYNFVTAVGRALRSHVSLDDLPIVRRKLVEESMRFSHRLDGQGVDGYDERNVDDDERDFVASGLGELLSKLPIESVAVVFDDLVVPRDATLLCELVQNSEDPGAVEVAARLVKRGVEAAIFALMLSLGRFSNYGALNRSALDRDLRRRLFRHSLPGPEFSKWAPEALRYVVRAVSAEEELRAWAATRGTYHQLLALACSKGKNARRELVGALRQGEAQLTNEELIAIAPLLDEIVWPAEVDLLLRFISRGPEVCRELIEETTMLSAVDEEYPIPAAEMTEWIHRLVSPETGDEGKQYWYRDRLGGLLARADAAGQTQILAAFESGTREIRQVLARHVLPSMPSLSVDMLGTQAIEYLLESLSSEVFDSFDVPLLGTIATESLIEDKILPLLGQQANLRLQQNVKLVLRSAGERHGRRYIVD